MIRNIIENIQMNEKRVGYTLMIRELVQKINEWSDAGVRKQGGLFRYQYDKVDPTKGLLFYEKKLRGKIGDFTKEKADFGFIYKKHGKHVASYDYDNLYFFSDVKL